MTFKEAALPLLVYLLPMLFFVYMGTDVLLRNPKKTEHRLVSLIIACYFLLFLEEYVRQLLPVSYSPLLSALWFSNVGIAIPGLGFHLFVKFSGMDKLMPRWLYPYLFYTPLLVVPLSFLSRQRFISAHEFSVIGLWKWPVYNMPYYIALTASVLVSLLSLAVLFHGRTQARSPEHRAIFNQLIIASIVTNGWIAVFGYFRFGEILPPYPYIFGGIVWCFLLRHAMKKYEFLHFNNQRYEKLFHLNPAAILLIGPGGVIREANPSARQLFHHIDLARTGLGGLASAELIERLREKQAIRELETTIRNGKH
ncbi:hypothetical protein SAMN02799630_04030 [Paenibacillus sp. UNCCL117]|uniref:PAS domain-containing protein n=1 Tax=unclassified Paenibacillus TaxID=185978 RepID=UPI00087FE349|nr:MULTISPECIES: PAS domain-containing protein [unclassified Paenibacillus]SDD78340.1 hypothetical protein SAMN04488602_11395 [Paenibacillus sp. cl123]SFW52955.1 hypothetical protein SAMN02799630_04030 [Paenibacillus sp. UNCCL117]